MINCDGRDMFCLMATVRYVSKCDFDILFVICPVCDKEDIDLMADCEAYVKT